MNTVMAQTSPSAAVSPKATTSPVTSVAVFKVDEIRVALAVETVERVTAAADLAPLPGAPTAVLGVANFHGVPIAVFDLRRRLGRAGRPQRLSDKWAIVRAAKRSLALVADEVEGVRQVPAAALLPAATLVPGARYLTEIATLPDGLIFIHDPDEFLSPQDERDLEKALSEIGRQ